MKNSVIQLNTTAPAPSTARYQHTVVALLAALLLIISGGCEQLDPHYGEDEYQEYVVVESHLIAGRPLPLLLLTRTMPVDEEFSLEEAAVSDATVEVQLLDRQSGDVTARFPYRMDSAGVYRPDYFFFHNVSPGGTYRLEVVVPEYGELTATTTVPQPVTVVDPLPETIVYQCDSPGIPAESRCEPGERSLTIDPGADGDRQKSFILSTIALEPGVDRLTPFYRDLLEEEEEENEWQNYISNASPMLNEGSFERDEEGLISLRYPWLGAVFFGENLVVINSLDRNIADFVRSQSVQLGGSTLSPGEIPNVIQNVEGGLRIFGSITSDTISVNLVPPAIPSDFPRLDLFKLPRV